MSGGELFHNLIILKSFRFLIFKIPGTRQKKCHKMRFGGKIFLTLAVPARKILNLLFLPESWV
jgi:hypothetical protein